MRFDQTGLTSASSPGPLFRGIGFLGRCERRQLVAFADEHDPLSLSTKDMAYSTRASPIATGQSKCSISAGYARMCIQWPQLTTG